MRFHALMVTAIAMTWPSSRSVNTAAARAYTSSGDVPSATVSDRLRQRQRGPLTLGEQAAGLLPRGEDVELLLADAVLAGVAGVHVRGRTRSG